MFSQSEENYLKTIFNLEVDFQDFISTNTIAERMKTKASSVTDMLKKLAKKNLIIYKKYQGAKLSKSGKKIAISIIRKHRLWECFLVDKLNFNWDEVHEIAEQLEHIRSKELILRLEEYLDFPTIDPHGDPIPDKNGKINFHKGNTLADAKVNVTGVIIGVKDSSDDFLKFLKKLNISLGTSIKIIDKESFDQSLTIIIDKKEVNISHQTAKNIFIK